MARTDLRSLPRHDQAFLGLGALILVASFLPWWGYTISLRALGSHISTSWSENAWHGLMAFGVLLMLAATALAAEVLLSDTSLPAIKVPWNVVVVALDALGAVFMLIKSFNLPSGGGQGVSVGLRWGGWILLVAAIAQVVVGLLRLRASGEPMPWVHHPAAAPESPAA